MLMSKLNLLIEEDRETMAKSKKHRLTLQVEPEHIAILREIALRLEYKIPTGKNAGMGSISALLKAIALGKVEVNDTNS